MIQFVIEDGRVRFVIDVGATSRAAESQLKTVVARGAVTGKERSAKN